MSARPPRSPRVPIEGFEYVDPSSYTPPPKTSPVHTAILVAGPCRAPRCACNGKLTKTLCPGCGQFVCAEGLARVTARSRPHSHHDHAASLRASAHG